MLHLLKEKSKVAWKAKERKKYPVLKPDLSQMKQPAFDFAQELKDLNQKGAEAYLKKTNADQEDPMQIDSQQKKKGNH